MKARRTETYSSRSNRTKTVTTDYTDLNYDFEYIFMMRSIAARQTLQK